MNERSKRGWDVGGSLLRIEVRIGVGRCRSSKRRNIVIQTSMKASATAHPRERGCAEVWTTHVITLGHGWLEPAHCVTRKKVPHSMRNVRPPSGVHCGLGTLLWPPFFPPSSQSLVSPFKEISLKELDPLRSTDGRYEF